MPDRWSRSVLFSKSSFRESARCLSLLAAPSLLESILVVSITAMSFTSDPSADCLEHRRPLRHSL